MRKSILRGPPEGIDIGLPEPDEGTKHFDNFLETPAGVRAQGGAMAAGAIIGGYAAFGAIIAVEVVTVTTFLSALSVAAAPALAVGGLYVLATGDGDVLDALDQVAAITDTKGAGQAIAKQVFDQMGGPDGGLAAEGPREGPVRDDPTPVSRPSQGSPEPPAPGPTIPDQFAPPPVTRPTPIEIDNPRRPKEIIPGPRMTGELREFPSDGEGRGPREGSLGNDGSDDSGSSGSDSSSGDPCDKLGGAKPEYCD